MLQELIPILDRHRGRKGLRRVQDVRKTVVAKGLVEELVVRLIASFAQRLQDVQVRDPLAPIVHRDERFDNVGFRVSTTAACFANIDRDAPVCE